MLDIHFDETLEAFKISDAATQVLQDQAIDDDSPGTILRDFDTLLNFVGEEGLRSSGKYFFLPQSQLNDLNAVMSRPVEHQLKRPQQRSFPHLHGLYLLLRASGMGLGAGKASSGRLILDPETVQAWRSLNATERYFALLESWLVLGTPEVIGEHGGWGNTCLNALLYVAQKLRRRKSKGGGYRDGGVLNGTTDSTAVALMEMFGWVRLKFDKPEPGEGVKIAVIERLPLGDAMVNLLRNFSFASRWPGDYNDEIPVPGVLLPAFQPYFPEYRQALTSKEREHRDGTYVWRVSLSKAWRRIAAPADMLVDDLAMIILDAFDFEADHLYCFEIRQTNGRTMRIACPYEEDAAVCTDEIVLGDVPLAEGDSMTMIFDYGDDWRFNVKLEKVTPPDGKPKVPSIIEEHGTPPAQYAWDDDEDEDEC